MRYFRGGKALKIHFGTSSKLQCPILFMKSMYAMYKTVPRTEPQPIKMGVNIGIENNMKYTTCSANGWMTAVNYTVNCVRTKGNCELIANVLYCHALCNTKTLIVTGHNGHVVIYCSNSVQCFVGKIEIDWLLKDTKLPLWS